MYSRASADILVRVCRDRPAVGGSDAVRTTPVPQLGGMSAYESALPASLPLSSGMPYQTVADLAPALSMGPGLDWTSLQMPDSVPWLDQAGLDSLLAMELPNMGRGASQAFPGEPVKQGISESFCQGLPHTKAQHFISPEKLQMDMMWPENDQQQS